MLKILSGFLLLYFLLFVSCQTIQGTYIATEQKYGNLWVTAAKDSAKIFLDEKDTGKITPALLEEVPVGERVVQVLLSKHTSSPDLIRVNVKENKTDSLFFDLQEIQFFGDLRIITNPDSALIIVDNLPQGYSPLTLNGLAEGQHTVKIRKGSHAPEERQVQVLPDSLVELNTNLTRIRSVLIEHFSNTDCIPCVEGDLILEEILTQQGVAKTVSLGYHANFPGPSDPMYLAARPGNDSRMLYYTVVFAPTIRVDGIIGFGTDIRNKLNDALAQRSPVAPGAILEIFDYQVSQTNGIRGRVRIGALENLSNVTLRIALIEKEINISPAPGTNGQTYFFDVFRAFYPNPDGIAITLAAGEKRFVPFNVSVDPQWILGQIQAVVFLQRQSKEIVQAAWTEYP